jgi:hypothetical protein
MTMATEQNVLYVYGVARTQAGREPISPGRSLAGIVPGATVEPLVHGDLMAFVSAVPSSRFGADEFRAALSDVNWLRDCVLAHERVLEGLRLGGDIVPFRFGTIYSNAAHASGALVQHQAELRQALDRIRDAGEWGVKIYCEADKLHRHAAAESAAIRLLQSAIGEASPGARFFLQKKYAKALDSEAAEFTDGCVRQIRQKLKRCARELADVALQPAAAHGRKADMVMNVACLVSTASLPRFQQSLADLQRDYAVWGFDHELTGPWPPYHFVRVDNEGDGCSRG